MPHKKTSYSETISELEARLKRMGDANKMLIRERSENEATIAALKKQRNELRDELARCGDGRLIPRGDKAPPILNDVQVAERHDRARLKPVTDTVAEQEKPKLEVLPPRKPARLLNYDRIVAVLTRKPWLTKAEIAVELDTTQGNIGKSLYEHRQEFRKGYIKLSDKYRITVAFALKNESTPCPKTKEARPS